VSDEFYRLNLQDDFTEACDAPEAGRWKLEMPSDLEVLVTLAPVPEQHEEFQARLLWNRYRGREISQEDILYIRALIERHPNESLRTLSAMLCEAWQWRQANGTLRDMVCRGLLLMLERAAQITLPPVSYVRHNPLANRAKPEPGRGSIPRRSKTGWFTLAVIK
jgi:hypothetical protein